MSTSTVRSLIATIPASILKFSALLSVAVLMVWLSPSKNNAFGYRYAVGKVWTYPTLTADFDFPVYKPTEQVLQEQETALQAFAPCYQLLSNSTPYVVSADEYDRLNGTGYSRIRVINRRHVAREVPLTDIYTPRSAYEITHREIQPNLSYDSLTSTLLYDNLLQGVSLTEGAVMKGETIIEHGAVITAEHYRKLQSLGKTYTERGISKRHQMLSTASTGVLILLFLLCFAAYLIIFRRSIWEQKRAVLFYSLITAILSSMTVLMLRFFPTSPTLLYVVPYVWIPILVRVFYDSRTAFILHLTNVFIASLVVPEPFLFLLLQLPAGMVAIVSLKDLTSRAQLALTAGYILLCYAGIYTVYHLMLTGSLTHLSWHPYACFGGNAVLIVGVYILIYLFEKLFGLVSSITLIELSNLNSDLMHTFADKAPGTFQHSLQVSSLASDAAKSIGAKGLLVRTGALYHDIGKMAHPDWYVENQGDGPNPLLAMTNRDAARAVIAHVTEGERLARKHGLPEVIVTFIRSHHGTSLVRYFYNSEVNRLHKEHPQENINIPISEYQYPGPRPTTKEEAILMMADAVEARARSLNTYTEQSLREMVEQMVGQQIQDGQFADTPLTFSDVERIKRSFCEKLLSIHHHRIQYPTIENK